MFQVDLWGNKKEVVLDKRRSPERREKIRQSQLGHKMSEKTREALRRGREKQKGSGHWHWRGGRWLDKRGYVRIYVGDHPDSHKNYRLEHAVVMEKFLGRKLKPKEGIHHKNGIKTDNRLENLMLVVNETHWGKVYCPECGKEFLIK